ncbi:unnamed protein product [Gongylonema pulchrum]|uniref:Uncharacterized protein n=1 Tax=Gongylonema pulchrum TaxID=637853 RepID=A0A183F1R5_9BILA|nr:unnamed protein product [Gongylonema pulchrum]
MESKWAEVRAILLERDSDASRKTSNAESIAENEQYQMRQLTDTINELKSRMNEQNKKLEHDKVMNAFVGF